MDSFYIFKYEDILTLHTVLKREKYNFRMSTFFTRNSYKILSTKTEDYSKIDQFKLCTVGMKICRYIKANFSLQMYSNKSGENISVMYNVIYLTTVCGNKTRRNVVRYTVGLTDFDITAGTEKFQY